MAWLDRDRDFPGNPTVRLHVANAGGIGWIPSWVTKIPHVSGHALPREKETIERKTLQHRTWYNANIVH